MMLSLPRKTVFFLNLVLMVPISYLLAKEEQFSNNTIHPPRVGNFSIDSSQQPSPLIGFGENIIPKGCLQTELTFNQYAGKHNYHTEISNSWLYGINDAFSIHFTLPYLIRAKDNQFHSEGLQDITLQLEYVLYEKTTLQYEEEMTIVGNVSFPTGSTHKNPVVGSGSPSFFIGTTYGRMFVNWYYFAATGGVFSTYYDNTKFGNQYLYQCGVGKSFYTPPGWIFAWLVELCGTYYWRDRIEGKIDKNSGGNAILIIPSLWISSKNTIFQLGMGPIFENLNGNQLKQKYSLDFQFTWTF